MSISLMLDKYEISDSWKKATNSEAHINLNNFLTNILEQMYLLKMYTVQIRIIDNLTAWKFASTDEEINKFFFAHDRLLSIELELKKKISELAIERNVTDLKIRK
jgi:hypothetical protein